MARTLKLLWGTGAGGDWTDGQDFLISHAIALKDTLAILAAGGLCRDLFVGGSETEGIPADATGDVRLYNFVPFRIPNDGDQLSNFDPLENFGATLDISLSYLLRVSDPAINVTPIVWYAGTFSDLISAPTVATISGAAACSDTAADYSGSDQYQVIDLTLPTGTNFWAAGLTIAGIPAPDFTVWGRAWHNRVVNLP